MFKALVPTVAFLLAAPGSVSAQMASKEVHRTIALDRDGQVSIETYKGSVHVNAWDRAEAEITARIVADEACGDSKYQAEVVKDTEVRISGEGRSLSLRSDYDRLEGFHTWSFWPFGSCSARPFVHYTISMPATARLELKDYKSDISIAGLGSEIRLSTYKGEVRLTGLGGALRLDTYKGDVKAAFAKMSGDSSFETHKGEIEITMPKDARFALSADVGRHGRLHSDFPVTTTLARRSRSRDERVEGAVNGGGPSLRLSTSNGSFRLRSS
jgi:hypothetical protein